MNKIEKKSFLKFNICVSFCFDNFWQSPLRNRRESIKAASTALGREHKFMSSDVRVQQKQPVFAVAFIELAQNPICINGSSAAPAEKNKQLM